ncbi:MAG: DUF4339 domain-containing protein [Methyloceanibacter sp.]|jgi:hypothetical protein
MQKAGVNENNAELVGARWYLSRDGEQHGPLSDRELSLFAEGGNFQPGDLLWTEGLDEWKSADAIFGLAEADDSGAPVGEPSLDAADAHADDDVATERTSAPERHGVGLADDPLLDDTIDENVGALAKALRGEAEAAKLSFQAQLIADLRTFGGFCAYLWIVFAVLTLHALATGAQLGIGLSFFILTTLNAFVLMRAWPVLERQSFLQSLQHKPLIYTIGFKTLVFGVGLVLAYAVEMSVLGVAGIGSGPSSVVGGFGGVLAWILILGLALLPYFTFREVEVAVGSDMMRKLLFRRH